jgi:benzoate-CoA ligase family protein
MLPGAGGVIDFPAPASGLFLMTLFARLFPADRDARTAILYERHELTYAELREETIRAAAVLSQLPISPGERVAILLADSPGFIVSFVAVISVGAIAVPINLALRREEQLLILRDCGARVAIVEGQLMRSLFDEGDAPAELREILVVRAEDGVETSGFNGIKVRDFASAKISAPVVEPTFHDQAKAALDADAFILYTSGSTGEPKGAVHSQADIFYTNETYCRQVLNLRAGDRFFSSSRLPFAYGLGNAFTFPLLNGFTSVLCRDKPSAPVISRIFSEYRPTIFFGVPVAYRMLLDHHRNVAPVDTSSLRLCVSAGEALPAHLGEEWQATFGVQVLDGIGSTEMLHMFMSNHDGELRYGSSGTLLTGYEARLIDYEGVQTPPGEAGNLWIRGGSAASRYWNRPQTSAQAFVDGWVRTGDLYAQDSDGFWWHKGRGDDCFKSSGQWVSPVEVEGVLIRAKSVQVAAVVEGRDRDGLSCVCAFVVIDLSGDRTSAEAEARSLCQDSLPRFKQPRRYIFVNELPYTATGKVQRFKLREQLRAERV